MGFKISVTIYILTILLLSILKPNFIWDNENNEYKIFIKLSNGQNISTFQIIAVLLSLIFAFMFHQKNNQNTGYQIMPVPISIPTSIQQ